MEYHFQAFVGVASHNVIIGPRRTTVKDSFFLPFNASSQMVSDSLCYPQCSSNYKNC